MSEFRLGRCQNPRGNMSKMVLPTLVSHAMLSRLYAQNVWVFSNKYIARGLDLAIVLCLYLTLVLPVICPWCIDPINHLVWNAVELCTIARVTQLGCYLEVWPRRRMELEDGDEAQFFVLFSAKRDHHSDPLAGAGEEVLSLSTGRWNNYPKYQIPGGRATTDIPRDRTFSSTSRTPELPPEGTLEWHPHPPRKEQLRCGR